MRAFLRPAALALTALCVALAPYPVAAQRKAPPVLDNQWYVGPQGGLLIFETQNQTKGAIPAAGGHVFINLNRVGVFLQVLEGIGSTEVASYYDPSSAAPGNARQVTFNDIRIFNGMVVIMPIRSIIQPYFGLGVAFVQVVNPQPSGAFGTQLARDNARDVAQRVANYGAGSVLGGVQFKVDRFSLFGQAQAFTAAPVKHIYMFDTATGASILQAEGRVFEGPIFSLTAGVRFGIGSARSEESLNE